MSKSYRLNLIPEAKDDLIRLRDFIREHNPAAANRAAKRIREGMSKLTSHPFLGRQVSDINTQELRDIFIPFGKSGYWVRYMIFGNEVYVIKIWNGRENR